MHITGNYTFFFDCGWQPGAYPGRLNGMVDPGHFISHRSLAKRRVPVHFINNSSSNSSSSLQAGRLEKWGVVIFLALFAAVINLPRLLMFFQGGNVMELGPYDENWHIQQLVSVARTGIPPYNYFFPSIHLGYYYGSWVYPAILGNLPILEVSLMRTMAIHAYLQIFAFLGLVYVLLQVNIRHSWVRLAGICFFTIMGGFDLFAKLPGVDDVEYWIRDPGCRSASLPLYICGFPITLQGVWLSCCLYSFTKTWIFPPG